MVGGEIPEIALKEAIINALSHRDYYDKGGRILIELFDDRLEITNPGGLVSAIRPNEFGTKSSSRNPLIFGLFERIHMVEQVGSGINRIKTALSTSGLPKPDFKIEGMFSIVFYRTVKKTREKTREKIIDLINQDKQITTEIIAKNIGITIKGVEYHLSNLKKDKILKRIGPDKGGYWVIDKRNNK
ncbi:MAG: ATP-binding protein [Bacteroidota bacterium]|nr:ATP-binding protein [Bacteroidota bacterium]